MQTEIFKRHNKFAFRSVVWGEGGVTIDLFCLNCLWQSSQIQGLVC